MSADLEGEHFAHPSEPGAHGHQQWLRENAELAEALKGDPWALAGEPIHRGESVTEDVAERHAAFRSEARTAHHAGVPDQHSPEL